ncbi:MAG TPA: SIS domain-containing protein, partial [Thermomicrobiales bacterium]|nr:SIS domain-containing protein [Thermomicrobiales bacterium]
MCGVFGFTGAEHDVEATVGSALRALEYRGYDSWGVSWTTGDRLSTRKKTGRLTTGGLPSERTSAAIGHTRWATHGGVTDANAHPHADCSRRFSVVHNGIIENAEDLRRGLERRHELRSTTDSEVVPHLLEDALGTGSDLAQAVSSVFAQLKGNNAIVVLDGESGEIHAICDGSPLLVAEGDLGSYIASDVIAFNRLATQMSPIPDRTLTRLTSHGIGMQRASAGTWNRPTMIPVVHRENDALGSFSHFTEKEIAEQPAVIDGLCRDQAETATLAGELRAAKIVILTGCGSAYFAARMGASWISRAGGTPALAVPASEFAEMAPFLDDQSLVIALSQSGETADVIDAIGIARQHGARVHAIVNVPYSTVARLTDRAYPLHAGIEQSVLATKSLMAMATRLYLAAAAL